MKPHGGMKRRVKVLIVRRDETTPFSLGLKLQQTTLSRSEFEKLDRREEGVSWAYGWYTEAANALRVAVSL